MGTRHYQTVINKEGETKVAQYGQWDGYPDGKGLDILNFLQNADLKKYQLNLNKIKPITEEQIESINKLPDWYEKYPHLSRDCGAKIHKLIENNKVDFVSLMDESDARNWCEGFYTINFKTNEFVSEYYSVTKTFSLDNLPTKEEYINAFN